MSHTSPVSSVWPGEPEPRGATYSGSGTNFSVFSEVAERVELCLFDDDGTETRVTLPARTGHTHHGFFPGIIHGQRYGYRVHGPWRPEAGVRCNPNKLLLDPYAKAIEGDVTWGRQVYGHVGNMTKIMSPIDSSTHMPRSVVVDTDFDWGADRPPRIPKDETVIYETHVKGITKLHPDVPEALRGTYAGLADPSLILYLKRLGVTAVELLPVHQFVPEHFTIDLGLTNYWGYSSIGYLAPHNAYSSSGDRGEQVNEFKQMVKTLHQANIEVILDVVYNHTCEGNELGPMFAFKGLDNPVYYRLNPDDRSLYVDYTGTGNTLNMQHPNVLQLMMDSLRYWVAEMHVDGFRFDLASALARDERSVDRMSAFFNVIHQDPVVNQVKLIAEPWDVGDGGYQVGNFPTLWSEWNGKYRDDVRDYWRGADFTADDFASRLAGSSDLYKDDGRVPQASINFVTAHDGFTLADLVSYNHKHNAANGEANQDGDSHNRSWNSGEEGPSTDPEVLQRRAVRTRSMLATLFLSQGVPMLLGGDEFGRSQGGNNNAYCQDNTISWYDWSRADRDLIDFVAKLAQFRREHPVLRRRGWLASEVAPGARLPDALWFAPTGEPMTSQRWTSPYSHSFTLFLNGATLRSRGPQGERIHDESVVVMFNGYDGPVDFRVPRGLDSPSWHVKFNTGSDGVTESMISSGERLTVAGWGLVVLESRDSSATKSESVNG